MVEVNLFLYLLMMILALIGWFAIGAFIATELGEDGAECFGRYHITLKNHGRNQRQE